MNLTDEQKATLKSDMVAKSQPGQPLESALAGGAVSGDFDAVAAYYNALAAPDYWVWRMQVQKSEIVGQPSQDGTMFTWAGNGFIGRTQGELSAWQELFADGFCDPSLPNVRQAFQDIFSGTGNAQLNRAHLLAVCRRKASVAEKMFASGTASPGAPATLSAFGELTGQECSDIYSAAQ